MGQIILQVQKEVVVVAQHSLEPAPTKAELFNVARLVLERKKEIGYTTNREVAEAIGLQESELSRLLNAKIERDWGFSRLARVANWLGMTLDGILGRQEGVTKLILPGGLRPHAVPVIRASRIVTSGDEMARIVRKAADARTRLHLAVAAEVGAGKAETIVRLVDGYLDQEREIQKGFGS